MRNLDAKYATVFLAFFLQLLISDRVFFILEYFMCGEYLCIQGVVLNVIFVRMVEWLVELSTFLGAKVHF